MKLFFHISVFILFSFGAFAQIPSLKIHELGEAFQWAKPELIYEDLNSTLWLGTTDGLFLYDGIDFQPFIKKDSTSNHVRSIFRDSKNRLWIGYQDGSIYHLKKQKFHHWQPEEGNPAVPVNGFAEDKEGNIWISTYGEGVYYFDEKINTESYPGRLYNFNEDDGLLGNDVYVMAIGKDGKIWLGTDGGISICSFFSEQKKIENLTRKDGLPDDIVRAILPDKKGNFWIGTYDGGVCYYDQNKKLFTQPFAGQNLGIVNCLEIFEETELWIGTLGNGVWRYALPEGKIDPLQKLGRAKITDLHRDIEGNIWVLSKTHGIYSANRRFEFIKTDFENMQAVLVDRNDQLWVGTPEGLFIHQLDNMGKSTFRRLLPQNKLNILSLYEDEFGNIWIGTFGDGLFIFQPSTNAVRRFTEEDGISNDNILSIDGIKGHVWLATLGGASEIKYAKDVFDGAKLKYHNLDHESGLGTNFIYKVFIDSQQRTWFGTDGKGISVLENNAVKNYPVAPYLNENNSINKDLKLNAVYSITEDKNGNIWLSTDKTGIFKFDGKEFTRLTVKEGIRDLEITSLATDANGEIVIIHSSGIDILTPETKHLIYYDKEVGIHDLAPNLNAICTDRFGNIWAGGANVIIKYTALKEELKIHPRTLLNNVSIFLEPVDFNSINKFSHHQNNLVFNYMGLWYTDPEVVKYHYQLMGFDSDWIESKDRHANYSNLPPGQYTFRVKSSANDSWSDEPIVEYDFEIFPLLWMRWWFIALCVLLLAGLFYAYQKNRDRRVQRLNLLEKDKVENQLAVLKAQINPHFLFNSFNTLITVIEEDPNLAVEYVENLSDFYRKIIQLRDKDVISIKKEVELVKNFGFLLQKRYGDSFRMNIRLNGKPYFIVPLTLQILVENAVKHNIISKSKPLSIDISIEGDDYITVTNNVQKKLTQEKSTRFGLQSLVQRYEMMGGLKVIVVETEKEFKISIPLIK